MSDPYRVLVVDDDTAHRTMLRTLVGDWGYAIVDADDGEAAVATVRNQPVDLVLMDIRMVRVSGIEALEQIKSTQSPVVFMDVNLRDPWWRREQVLEWVAQADWVKLNEEELERLQEGEGELNARAGEFLQRHGLAGLVVTRGSKGAILLQREQSVIEVAPVQALQVIDTVGAGDALASVLLLGLMQKWPMQETLERAQHFASAVVGQRGATAEQPDFYRPFIEAWGLSR